MRYKIKTRVKSVEQVTRVVSACMIGDKVVQETENMGWFVCFEGSWERLGLGREEPELVVGQAVEIIIRGL